MDTAMITQAFRNGAAFARWWDDQLDVVDTRPWPWTLNGCGAWEDAYAKVFRERVIPMASYVLQDLA